MNPQHFRSWGVEDVLSTLVHEMTHLEQQHFGSPGRRGYHNKAWGILMRNIGLEPTNTGEPGGKDVGQQMTHFIIPDGPFDEAVKTLIKKGFRLSWADSIQKKSGKEDEALASGGKAKSLTLFEGTGEVAQSFMEKRASAKQGIKEFKKKKSDKPKQESLPELGKAVSDNDKLAQLRL